MDRRTVLAAGTGMLLSLAGCLRRSTVGDTTVDVEIAMIDSEVAVDAAPTVSVTEGTVTIRGTVRYGSSSCGTVSVAHAGYERSQERLDVLVVAADAQKTVGGCTDDLVDQGYRATVTVDERLRRVAVTEHHVFGETYSTTRDLTDY